jgi:hypothetical protein
MADEASRPVQGGAAQPTYITNLSLPASGAGVDTAELQAINTKLAAANALITAANAILGNIQGNQEFTIENLGSPIPDGGVMIAGNAGGLLIPLAVAADGSLYIQGAAAHDTAAAGNPLLGGAYASDTPPANVTLADAVRLWAKLNGAQAMFNAYALNSTDDAVQAYPPATALTVATTAYAASLIAKTAPGTLVSLHIYNSKASAQFIQIHNSTTLPADTAVPLMTLTVAASSNLVVTLPLAGLPCTAGIVICNSSTGPTKTIGSADVYITAVMI